MSDMKMTLKGVDDVQKQVKMIESGLNSLKGYKGLVGSRMPYAYGAEFGRHRKSGKLARRAGGVGYLTRAVDTMLNSADADISQGLEKVKAPGRWILKRLALWVRRLARANAPRVAGRLRRSIRAEVRKG